MWPKKIAFIAFGLPAGRGAAPTGSPASGKDPSAQAGRGPAGSQQGAKRKSGFANLFLKPI
jgi:hypothetical protein